MLTGLPFPCGVSEVVIGIIAPVKNEVDDGNALTYQVGCTLSGVYSATFGAHELADPLTYTNPSGTLMY
jgi:hypothetical protein